MKKTTTFFLALLASTGLLMASSIEIDGNFSDRDAVPANQLVQAALDGDEPLSALYKILFSANRGSLHFRLEHSSDVYYVGIHMNIDGNANTGWNSFWWNPSGVDYLIEGCQEEGWWSNIAAYIGNGTEWQWEGTYIDNVASSVTTASGNGVMVMNGSISLPAIPTGTTYVEVGVIVYDKAWNEIGLLPVQSTPMLQVPLSSTPERIENPSANSGVIHKLLRDGQIVILRGNKTYTLQGQEVK